MNKKNIYKYLMPLFMAFVKTVFCQPVIEISQRTYDAGEIEESARISITHSFEIKNRGKDNLAIKNVRKSCGCTAVKYDTLIAPGQKGIITPEVDLTGYSGEVEKSITVESNAENEASLRLLIRCKIIPHIEISKRFVRLRNRSRDTVIIQLKTKKTDLQVQEIFFRPENNKTALKKADMTISHSLQRRNNEAIGGLYTYDLVVIFRTNLTGSSFGDFVMVTNHPEKKELKITGMIRNEH